MKVAMEGTKFLLFKSNLEEMDLYKALTKHGFSEGYVVVMEMSELWKLIGSSEDRFYFNPRLSFLKAVEDMYKEVEYKLYNPKLYRLTYIINVGEPDQKLINCYASSKITVDNFDSTIARDSESYQYVDLDGLFMADPINI